MFLALEIFDTWLKCVSIAWYFNSKQMSFISKFVHYFGNKMKSWEYDESFAVGLS